MATASTHPVLAAIDTEVERLEEIVAAAREQVSDCEREIEAHRRARAIVSEAVAEDAPAPAESSQVPEQEQPLASPRGRGSPGPGSDRAVAQASAEDAVLAAIRESSTPIEGASNGALVPATGLTSGQVNHACSRLLAAGKILREGKGRWTRYRPVEVRRPVSSGPAQRANGNGESNGSGSVEGRICAALQLQHRSLADLAATLEQPAESLQGALSKLIREREVRTLRKNGQVVFAFVG